MSDFIEQQIISLLQPLLSVDLKSRDDVVEEGSFADLEIVSDSAIGMGSEFSQGVDDLGNQIVYVPHQAEIAIRYFGKGGVIALSDFADQLRRTSVSEQFQRTNIGIGRLGNVETVIDVAVDGKTVADAVFKFFIHYTVALNDAVGVIEHINAAYEGSEINIHLTR